MRAWRVRIGIAVRLVSALAGRGVLVLGRFGEGGGGKEMGGGERRK